MKDKVIQIASASWSKTRIHPRWIKWGFGLILFMALGFQLQQRTDTISWTALTIDSLGVAFIAVVILLSIVNWSLEALKWQLAVPLTKTFRQSIETVLVGLSFAVFTPGRIGDYAGRLLHTKSDSAQDTVLATFLCSIAQLTVTILAGLIACYFLMQSRGIEFANWSPGWLIIPLMTGIYVYFMADKIVNRIGIRPFAKRIPVSPITHIPSTEKLNILGLAFVRYSVYVIQMLILMSALEVKIPLTDAIFGVSILFLVQTMIPMPMLFQVATKIELAMLLWAPFDPSPLSLSIVMLVLWAVNVVAPALVGYRIMNFNKLIKTQKGPS